MTWQEHNTDPIQVAAEHYLFCREQGLSLTEIITVFGQHGSDNELPAFPTGDDVIYWLAQIWDGRLAKDD